MTSEGWHTCHFCGTYVKDGKEHDGKRHWLSDCRPDLVKHEPGPLCTWHGLREEPFTDCYAYEDKDRKWTKDHIHFYPDGPM